MFSRALLRSLRTPQVARAIPRALPKATPTQSLSFRRFESDWGRFKPPPPPRRRPDKIIHTRWDPEYARNAKPLFTDEQLSAGVRSQTTIWIAVIAVGGGFVFYVTNLEEVPVSGRRRFNCYSDTSVEKEGERMYRMIMQEAGQAGALLPAWDKRSQMVQRVMDRLIPASGLEDVRWEVHVIESEKNAFVIPGGKVFVYSGILPIAKNDDGLAAILGHEIAHNLARHQAESMSSMILLVPLRWAIITALYAADSAGITFGLGQWLAPWLSSTVLQLGIAMPASRKQESEADYIGLMMMAKSCYDPSAAVGVWERMEAAEKYGIPEWMSTHPSNVNRIEKMQEWLPKAEEARNDSGCAVTTEYARGFQNALGGLGGWGGFTS